MEYNLYRKHAKRYIIIQFAKHKKTCKKEHDDKGRSGTLDLIIRNHKTKFEITSFI